MSDLDFTAIAREARWQTRHDGSDVAFAQAVVDLAGQLCDFCADTDNELRDLYDQLDTARHQVHDLLDRREASTT